MPPRRLTFAVSTSLLTASLAAGAGCHHRTTNAAPKHIDYATNPAPKVDPAEDAPVDDAPADDAPADDAPADDAPAP